MKIDLTKTAPENCPSWDKCETNACPLHENYHKTLWDLPEDKEIKGWRKCRTSKKVRMRIAKEFSLKNKGLTKRELASLRKSIEMKEHIFSTKDKNLEMPKNTTLEESPEVKDHE